jgi:hypothetical protein
MGKWGAGKIIGLDLVISFKMWGKTQWRFREDDAVSCLHVSNT